MRWKLKSTGEFTLQSFYEILRGSCPLPFPWKAIWRAKAPQRVSFFVWTVAWGKILTFENLIKRGYSMVSWFCMCHCSGKTVDYLLIYCSLAFKLWSCISWCLGFSGFYRRRFWFTMCVVMLRSEFRYMESYSLMFDVDYVEGTKLVYFWRCGVRVISIASILH